MTTAFGHNEQNLNWLLFLPERQQWMLALSQGVFVLADHGCAVLAAEFLPVCRLRQDDDQPAPCGTAELARSGQWLRISLAYDDGAPPAVVAIAAPMPGIPSAMLLKGRAPGDPWLAASGTWLLSCVRISYDQATRLVCHYYLPPHSSGEKRVTVFGAAAEVRELVLQRDQLGTFEIPLVYPGRHQLELTMPPDYGPEDERPLGFVLSACSLLAELDAASWPEHDRLQDNLREVATWSGGPLAAGPASWDGTSTAQQRFTRLISGLIPGPPSFGPAERPQQGSNDTAIQTGSAAYLVFDTRCSEWLLSLDEGLFGLADRASVHVAPDLLPVAVLREDDDEASTCGEATLFVQDDALDIVLRPDGATAPRIVRIPNALTTRPSYIWTRGRSTPEHWSVSRPTWLFAAARLECDDACGLRCSYYLPPRDAPTKELVVTSAFGQRYSVTLQRDAQGSFELRFPTSGPQLLEFSTDPEQDPADRRPLGFVLLGLELLPAPVSAPLVGRPRRERLRENLVHALQRLDPPRPLSAGPAAMGGAPRPARAPRRPRAAIVCWDLGHNPAGRAAVMYRLLERNWDCTLIGPLWPRFGRDLWAPLQGEGFQHRLLPVRDLQELWIEAAAAALETRYDLVIMCKPRLPAMLTALLIAEQSGAPLVIDIDEAEDAFHAPGLHAPGFDAPGLHATIGDNLHAEPFGAAGTRLSHRLLDVAGALTVSNPSLQDRHAGYVVRHARDELAPLPDRAAARARLGFAEDDFVIAFVGTLRPHKGLQHVLAALDRIDDPGIRLLVVGTLADAAVKAAFARQPPGRVALYPNCRLSELGEYLAAADLVPILQDPESAISQTQLPAKLADALQHGLTVVATDVPPLRDLAARGVITPVTPERLADTIRALRHGPRDEAARRRARLVFEEEFSHGVNRVRLEAAIRAATQAQPERASRIADALAVLAQATAEAAPRPASTRPASKPSGALPGRRSYDIAVFWKQNDSDLFGRRSDMVVKYLLGSGRVRHIVHFDLAAAARKLQEMALARAGAWAASMALELPNTVLRHLRLADAPGLSRRIMLTADENDHGQRSFCGRALAQPQDLADFVQACLAEAGLQPADTLAWCFPAVWGFADLVRQAGFRGVVVDLVDDQRAWPIDDVLRGRLEAEYAATLRAADLVFTNCDGNRDRFARWRDDIVIIPNGAELNALRTRRAPPAALAGLAHPIIGYTGNMNDRIDWALIDAVTASRPAWQFVFIGPYQARDVPAPMRERGNVHFLGPVPYADLAAYLHGFAVAIMPHLACALTDSMNPLKLYNYLAAGVPVVATAVANMQDVQGMIDIRTTPEGFVAAIEARLRTPAASPGDQAADPPADPALAAHLAGFDWARRIETMLGHVDARFAPQAAARPAQGAPIGDGWT